MTRLHTLVERAARIRTPLRSLFAAALAIGLAACGDTTAPGHGSMAAGASAAAAKGGPSASKGTNTLQVTISGLPTGTAAAVNVSGPNGYTTSLSASASLTGLANGTYIVSGSPVVVGTSTYAPSQASQSLSLRNGRTVSAVVSYAVVPTTGSLAVTITIGEPVPAAVTVTGPNGYTHAVTATTTIQSLAPGSYTITAGNTIGTTGTTYTPTPASQTASVQIGATASATVTYAATSIAPSDSLNLQIVGMYLTQSVQTMSGAVPMVAGRDAMLRVFALASGTNSAHPSVRARVYMNGALASTITVAAPATSVPTVINEGSATASWNILVPGSLVQPGLSVLADVDPDNTTPEANETDNRFPLSGTPLPMNVRTVPGLAVRFVPILQSATGATGDITVANSPTYLERLRDIHPVNTIATSVRAAYTSSYSLVSDGTNWNSVLGEINALRSLDGSNDQYYGVAHLSYTSGVVGIGYIGAPAALGWDVPGSAAEVMAHELGHNFGLYHAPCGGVAGPDPNYPYAGGIIGVYGWNVRTNTLMQPTTADLMGYCSPTWISDYNYLNVLNFRSTTKAGTITSADVQPAMLVWGTVAGDGSITLEPAARVTAHTVLPARGGSFSVEGTDAAGAQIFSVSFDPIDVSDDVPGDEEHFAFVVPLSDANNARLRSLSVHGNGRSATHTARLSSNALEAVAAAAALDAAGGNAHLRWSGTDVPLVVVRDPATGDVLSFARGGDIGLASAARELELIFSDGVHSTTRRTPVRGR